MSNRDHAAQITYMSDAFAIASYNGHEESQLSQKNTLASNANFGTLEPEIRAFHAYAQALDWIGTCFVNREAGDVIAVMVTINDTVTPHKVTFHVSNNLGGESQLAKKKPLWNAFIHLLNELKSEDFSDNTILLSGGDKYITHLVQFGWLRIRMKLTFIRDLFKRDPSGDDVRDDFTKLLNKLKTDKVIQINDLSPVLQQNKGETDDKFIERGVDHLQIAMTSLIEEISKSERLSLNATKEQKLQIYKDASRQCSTILKGLNSILVNHKDDAKLKKIWSNNKHMEKVAKRLHNRLTRLLKFRTGALLFLRDCLNIFREHTGVERNADLEFEVVWIEEWIESSGLPVAEDQKSYTESSYGAWLDGRINTILQGENLRIHPKSIQQLKQRVKTQFDKKRPGNKTIGFNPTFHCELAMIHYCIAFEKEPLFNFIGVTKLNCVSCSIYTKSCAAATTSYSMTGSSGKWHHNWFIPIGLAVKSASTVKQSVMLKNIMHVKSILLDNARDELLSIVTNVARPRKSVGSDSSTGSINIVLLGDGV